MLHTVNKSPFEKNSLSSCLSVAKDGSAILLIEDGVYAATKGTRISDSVSSASGVKIYVLGPDLKARGVAEEGVLVGVRREHGPDEPHQRPQLLAALADLVNGLVAVEVGVVMLMYLRQSLEAASADGPLDAAGLRRIYYKLLIERPSRDDFIKIFLRAAEKRGVAGREEALAYIAAD